MPEVLKPIFFIGMGRSGSSLIFDTFIHSYEVAFFSQYNKISARLPQVTVIHRFFSNYRPKHELNLSHFKKLRPISRESYRVWEYLCGKKFHSSYLRNIEATSAEKTKTNNYISKLLLWQGKNRFADKLTGPPRIKYLNSMFHDAIFVDVIRNPRAAVNSLINATFRKKKGLTTPYWDDSLTADDKIEWDNYQRSSVSLAALEWRSAYQLTKLELNEVNPNYIRVKYEDFINSPKKTIKTILSFVELDYTQKIDKFIDNTNFINANDMYHKNLSIPDLIVIDSICEKEILELGY